MAEGGSGADWRQLLEGRVVDGREEWRPSSSTTRRRSEVLVESPTGPGGTEPTASDPAEAVLDSSVRLRQEQSKGVSRWRGASID